MFAVVRTGGKQYRVAAGDKIVVERIPGEAGDTVTLGDVLLAGDGGELKSADGLSVTAEIVAQARGDKVVVFKKRRRHNYRRKRGHRQLHTILRITAIGDSKAAKPAKAKKAEAAPAGAPAKIEGAESPMTDTPAPKKAKKETAKGEAKAQAPAKAEPTASDQTDSPKPKKAPRQGSGQASTKKPAAGKAAGKKS